MKNLSFVIGVLFLIFIIGAFMENDTGEATAKFEAIAVHEVVVNSDVDEKEFEAFIVNELAPIYNKMEGQTLTLAKGEITIRGKLIAVEKRIAKIACSLFDGEGVEYAKADLSYFHFPERVARAKYHYPGIEAFYATKT